MLFKTSSLIGPALDRAVAKCEDRITADGFFLVHTAKDGDFRSGQPERYSTDCAQGGPIIDREWISTTVGHASVWIAYIERNYADEQRYMQGGPTRLIAAMRCFVASKFGNEVEIPEALL